MVEDGPDECDISLIVQEAVNRLPGGFVIFGPNHEILLSNEQNERDFHVTNDALRAGKSYVEAVRLNVEAVMPGLSPEDAAAAAESIVSSLSRGESVEVRTITGTILQIVQTPLSCGGWVAVGADITAVRERERELKRAHKGAEAANDAKSAFIANISHEIRTPLNGILGMAQLLASTPLNAEQRDQIETILDSGKVLMAILNDVLDLSKIEVGRFDISPIENDLGHLLRRLSKLWTPRAEEKGLALHLSIDPAMPVWVRFDPVRVRQCISNLVSNAIKFTEHGSISIAVSSAPDAADGVNEVRIEVCDTGPGISRETLDRLFTPFTQADAATSRRFGGTGLGLSISRKLARLMDGDVTAESEEEKGSKFTLTFRAPLGRGVDMDGTNPDIGHIGDARWAHGLRVLLVDDHALNRKVARLFLEPLGAAITEAENGEDAILHLQTQAFDLVLLDMHMPVMDGSETLRHIRAHEADFRNVPIIALTADSLGQEKARYRALGADGYVGKPIDHRELIVEIGRVLEARYGRAPAPSALLPELRSA